MEYYCFISGYISRQCADDAELLSSEESLSVDRYPAIANTTAFDLVGLPVCKEWRKLIATSLYLFQKISKSKILSLDIPWPLIQLRRVRIFIRPDKIFEEFPQFNQGGIAWFFRIIAPDQFCIIAGNWKKRNVWR
jgi:hypothetical protein